mgnify:CR=1 FL=1
MRQLIWQSRGYQMIKTMFEFFDKINSNLENNIAEISFKQSQMSIIFEDQTIVLWDDLMELQRIEDQYAITSISTFNECLHVVFSNLDETLINKVTVEPYSFLYSFIFNLKETLCSCPALEYVISSNYIKIYLDLPNIYARDIVNVDKEINSEGILELSSQRPYLLYVKDW